jgi:tetratricopeptide (TPR) repeat protein
MRGLVLSLGLAILGGACAHPAPAPSPRERARALDRRGEWVEAGAAYAQLLCQGPGLTDAPGLARDWVEAWDAAGRPEAARAELLACVADPTLRTYVEALAAGAMANWQRAGTLLAEALGTAPASWRPDLELRAALVALHTGEADAAFAHLEAARRAAPERIDIHLIAAQAYLGSNDFARTVEALRPLLRLRPSSNQLARARDLYHSAVEEARPPMTAADNAALKDLLAILQQERIGEEDLQLALRIAERQPQPRLLTVAGLVALKQGARFAGTRLLEDAERASPLDPDPPRLLGIAAVAQATPDEALEPLQEAARRNPFDVEIAQLLAQIAASLGRWQLAFDTYQTLTVLEPEVEAHHQALARCAKELRSVAP